LFRSEREIESDIRVIKRLAEGEIGIYSAFILALHHHRVVLNSTSLFSLK